MKRGIGIAAITLLALTVSAAAEPSAGERYFKEYCWGCHHQTAEAFGPSFRSIADKRTPAQIMAQIADPEHTYKSLGYARNSMPAFADLNASQLKALTDYILSFKDKK
ncbi:c-type cytochrome [Nitratifractor sp.]